MLYGIRLAVLGAFLALGAEGALAAESGRKVVVELFTSQGCSSCPPADAYLGELARRDDVVALSFHVDYWNYIGWRDPFSSPQWTLRQRKYGKALRRRYVYTPQVVIDGVVEAVGSRRSQIERLIAAAHAKPKIEIAVSHPDADSILIRLPASAAQRGRPATIWLALYDNEHTTPVRSGENNGVTVVNANVVRSMHQIGTWNGEAMELTLGLADLGAGGRDGCAVLVQERGAGRILGAARLALAQPAK